MNILMAVGFIAIPIAFVALGVGLRARHNIRILVETTAIQLNLPDSTSHRDNHAA